MSHLITSLKIVRVGKLVTLVIFYGVKHGHFLCAAISYRKGNGDFWLVYF